MPWGQHAALSLYLTDARLTRHARARARVWCKRSHPLRAAPSSSCTILRTGMHHLPASEHSTLQAGLLAMFGELPLLERHILAADAFAQVCTAAHSVVS